MKTETIETAVREIADSLLRESAKDLSHESAISEARNVMSEYIPFARDFLKDVQEAKHLLGESWEYHFTRMKEFLIHILTSRPRLSPETAKKLVSELVEQTQN